MTNITVHFSLFGSEYVPGEATDNFLGLSCRLENLERAHHEYTRAAALVGGSLGSVVSVYSWCLDIPGEFPGLAYPLWSGTYENLLTHLQKEGTKRSWGL